MNRLKELRKKRRLSQSEVCTECGIGIKTLYNYEHELVAIPHTVLLKLSEVYKVSVDYLLGVKNYTTITVADRYDEVVAVVTNSEIIEHTGYTVVLTED